MKNQIILLFSLVFIFLLHSCNSSEIKKTNKPITQKQVGFNSEGMTLGTYLCPYNDKQINSLLSSNLEKIGWPKIRITATFGGFGVPNNPCSGCDHCGCCLGFCIEIERKSSLTNSPLTNDEIENNEVLFDFIDTPERNEIILLPNSNIDNGDGYLHISEDCNFSKSVHDYIGHNFKLKKGSYQIVYNSSYPNGIVVVQTI
jgi:hypothetical protein